MSFRQLRGFLLAGPLIIFGVLEYSRWALGNLVTTWTGRLVMDGVVIAGAVCFYGAVAMVIQELLQRLERQNRVLKALRSAGLDITADLSLDTVLQKIVDQARQLLDCRYGALAVYDEENTLETFVTSGIDLETQQRIGDPPHGKGLLRLPLTEGHPLRLEEIESHPESAGFPAHHPKMHSLLAVPVICQEPFRGNLYLSEKVDASQFTTDDESILTRFAAQAAIAVDNAQLHAKVAGLAVMNERLRLAREMHDGQAQVLAYVNTKAQVIDGLMAAGKIDPARQHLHQMAAAAREVYADVREGILGLRTAIDNDHDLARVLKDFAERWQDQCTIPLELEISGCARYSSTTELQLLRILQEALANVRKHSQAKQAALRVTLTPKRLVAEVEDDGVGFELRQSSDSAAGALPKFGLITMQERCEEIGACLEVVTAPGRGTRVRVEYSVPEPA
ncbi:MAG: GAF domain-containing protein [Acidobacteriota bacterium]